MTFPLPSGCWLAAAAATFGLVVTILVPGSALGATANPKEAARPAAAKGGDTAKAAPKAAPKPAAAKKARPSNRGRRLVRYWNKLSKKQRRRLLKGKTVVTKKIGKNRKGKSVGVGVAYIIVKAPPAALARVLRNYSKQPEYMPRLTNCRVVKKRGRVWMVFLKLLFKFLFIKKRISYTLRMVYEVPNRRISWSLPPNKKNQIKDTKGFWQFDPMKGGKWTLVTYSVYTDTGLAVPGFIQNALVRGDLPGVLKNFKKRVESGGRWKKG